MVKSSSIDNYYKKTGFERHKGFFSVLFTLLLLIGVLVSFSAIQQQQGIRSKAVFPAGGGGATTFSIKAFCSGRTLSVKWTAVPPIKFLVKVKGPETNYSDVLSSDTETLTFNNKSKGKYTATLADESNTRVWDSDSAICSGGGETQPGSTTERDTDIQQQCRFEGQDCGAKQKKSPKWCCSSLWCNDGVCYKRLGRGDQCISTRGGNCGTNQKDPKLKECCFGLECRNGSCL